MPRGAHLEGSREFQSNLGVIAYKIKVRFFNQIDAVPKSFENKVCVCVCVLLFGVYLCVRMVPQDPKGIVKPTLLCLSLCAKWVVEQHRVTKKKKTKLKLVMQN